MTDMDVSLRLRLVNQLSRPAEEAERDLKELRKAVEQLGRTKGGDGLARGLAEVGQKADAAKGKIETVEKGADNARLAISRIGEGFGNFKADAQKGETALKGIERQAAATKSAIGRIDDNAFTGLKSDAEKAEAAIRQVGRAADTSAQKLRQLQIQGRGAVSAYGHPQVPGRRGMLSQTAGAAFDRLGGDAFIPLGAGAAYMAGGVLASGAVVAGAAIRASMNDEFTSDQLMVLGQYGKADQARYDRQLAAIGARRGTGTQGAMGVFGGLMSGGLSAQDASAMTENAIIFSKATQADAGDAAATTIALRNNLGIDAENMMHAYDAMALGGKEGQFEVPDMARNFPSLAAKMAAVGESGLQGVKGLVAMAQAIRMTAGTSDEAATNFENMLDKFTAPDFVEGASDIGINVEKTFKKAKEDGVSPVLALIEQIGRKVGNNPFKLSELLPDRQARAGVQAVLNNLKGVRDQIDNMGNSTGTVLEDYANATDNASAAFDRFSSNVASKAKYLATYALPPLTAAMNAMSDAMEGNKEPQQIEAPEGASDETKAAIHDANDRGARWNRFFEGLLGFDKSESSRKLDVIDAYRQYAESRMEGERKQPSGWDRFWWGDAADDDFSFRDHIRNTIGGEEPEPYVLDDGRSDPNDDLGRASGAIGRPFRRPNSGDLGESTGQIPIPLARPADLGQAAAAGMDSYNSALSAGGDQATAEAMSIADRIKAALGFTVSPTISPTYIQPSTGGVQPTAGTSEKHSSLTSSQSGNLKLTQHISSPNSRVAALRAQREANRSVRMAQSRALGDIGPRTA